jgi:hypothetical protein
LFNPQFDHINSYTCPLQLFCPALFFLSIDVSIAFAWCFGMLVPDFRRDNYDSALFSFNIEEYFFGGINSKVY